MRFLIIILLLFCATLVSAQSSGIDENEKRRLENQFKALKTFYINEDGLVVYQKQGNETEVIDDVEYNQEGDTLTVYVKNESEQVSDDHLAIDEEEAHETAATVQPSSNVSKVINTDGVVSISKQPINPLFIKKEARRTEAIADNDSYTEERSIEETEISDSSLLDPDTHTELAEESFDEDASRRKSVFDKRPSKYKTMEEAALAVEALLDDLRKEQAQSSNSGSMSSRLSGGVRSTLRKRPVSGNNSYQYSPNQSSQIVNNNSASEFGNEPTYYINGRLADKAEIDQLRKKDIINRQIRTRNTTSGNPNGEIWYEVREN